MADVIKLPRQGQQDGSSDHANAGSDAERQQRLFDWAFEVLQGLGLVQALANAISIEELQRITFDADRTEVILAIRNALRPPDGHRQEHFDGLREGALKKILKNRFNDLKRDREKELLGGGAQSSSTPDWTAELIFDKQGKITANVANITLMLRHVPAWQGVLCYCEFSGQIIIKQQAPWGGEEPDTPWTKPHITKTCIWFLRNGMNRPSRDDVTYAVEVVAKEHSFHPVQDYFESLVWDGVPRLEKWLQTYLMVKDSPYVQAISPRFLISSVARIYKPGDKVDHVLVLEGPQGKKKKSQTVKALVPNPKWCTDNLSNVTNKDAKMEVAGVMIIEVPEMEALTRATSSAMKKFITLDEDRFRPPYGREIINWPRQCVFIGTLNPIRGEGYLKDPTGARRFWPVECGKETDLEGLIRDRDQLWAEAVHGFKAGAKWWLETPELEALATAEQEARFARDDWEMPIREWLGNRTEVTVAEVLKGALGLSVTHSGEIRVAKILKRRLGFEQARPRNGSQRYVCYRRYLPLAEVTNDPEPTSGVRKNPSAGQGHPKNL
jgi:predicted P-loop ATPase